MLKQITMVASFLLLTCGPVQAGSVAGTGGATEVTQIMNNMELVSSYAKEVEAYVRQGMQYDTQLRNLLKNPASLLGPEAGALLSSVSSLMAAGNSIGATMAQVDQRLATKYSLNQAMTFSQRFASWTAGSRDSLSNSMKASGMRRDQYQSDTAALQALYDRRNAGDGAVAAMQTVADINLENTKQLMALGDLLERQHLATSDYLQGELAKADARQQHTDSLGKPLSQPVPDIGVGSPPSRWKTVLF